MATQQQPDAGRSYGQFPVKAGKFTVGPLEPARRKPAKPKPIDYYARYEGPKKARGFRTRRGHKGIRGERPAPILEPVPIDTTNDLGAAIRRERRAIGLTTEDAVGLTGVWGTCLAHMERGKDVKLSTLFRVLAGLGLQLTITRRAE